MDLTTNQTRFRTGLDRAASGGEASLGQWIEFPGYSLARTVASLPDVEWVLIDCEHGNIADADMYHSVAAVAAAGSSPIVRIPGAEPWMIKRALDSGAHGIMVPMVETEAQARIVANAARYPHPQTFPAGIRGVGGLFANANFNLSAAEYLRHANDQIVVIVQIESRLGVENCEDIAAVQGIDALFIGPNDLASSLGYFAFDHPRIQEVQEASARVLRAAKAKGKLAGHFCMTAEEAAKRIKQGWQFVNVGADLVAIANWMTGEMGRVGSLLGEMTGEMARE